jgi:hypothetical protein
MFFTLMVNALDLRQHPPGGLPLMFPSGDDGHSWISSSGTSQGTRRRRFLALMVGTPGSPAPAPPRGLTVDVS